MNDLRSQLLDGWLALQAQNPPKTKGALEDERGRCCLGNLCHIAAAMGIIRRTSNLGPRIGFDEHTADLPPAVRDLLGFGTSSVSLNLAAGPLLFFSVKTILRFQSRDSLIVYSRVM